MRRAELLDLHRRHVNAGMARVHALSGEAIETRSEGSLVFDQHDAAYLDCGGYCVFLLGHCHPHVVDAVVDSARRLPLSTRLLFEGSVGVAAQSLVSITPAGLDYVWFAGSGAESVDAALKLCRVNGRRRVIATEQGFHGKTLGALSVSGRHEYRRPFEPLLPDVTLVPFGDTARLEQELSRSHHDTAVLVEPVQSEAGVRIPPPGYLAALRELCDSYSALLVVDEISTGMGRIGSWWGVDAEGVLPDILLAGKALGGGVMPVSAMVARADVFEPFNRHPTLHTSTFGGSPLAAAAVSAAIEVAVGLDVPTLSATLGSGILDRVRHEVARIEPWFVTEVRGRGLLIGIECAQEHLAAEMVLELMSRRVIVSHSLNDHRVVRLTPPAVLNPSEVDWLVDAIGEALAVVAQRYAPPRSSPSPVPSGADDLAQRSLS